MKVITLGQIPEPIKWRATCWNCKSTLEALTHELTDNLRMACCKVCNAFLKFTEYRDDQ